MEKKKHAVVVDDNQSWLKTLERLVSNMGYDVQISQTYDSALERIHAAFPSVDLVVTDLRLRDEDESNIDGLRLLDVLRKQDKLRCGIIVTGYPTAETRQAAQELGAAYLEKGSFTQEEFESEVKKLDRQSHGFAGLSAIAACWQGIFQAAHFRLSRLLSVCYIHRYSVG